MDIDGNSYSGVSYKKECKWIVIKLEENGNSDKKYHKK